MDPQVFTAMTPWFTGQFGNAASATHLYGWEARDAVDEARERVATLIGADPREIIFTSGATESVNLAIKGLAEKNGFNGRHIITCVSEHSAVLDTCAYLENSGYALTYLPVDRHGLIDADQLEEAIRPSTLLVAIMYANNETGVLQPIREIASRTKKHGIPLFCDATQAVGKIPFDVRAEGIDLMAFSAHKMHGPKGTGVLYAGKDHGNTKLIPQLHGGGHERGLRSGTLNVPGIVGLGQASAICIERMEQDRLRLCSLRNRLETELLQIPESKLNGHPDHRLHHVTNIAFKVADARHMMIALSKNIAVSSGSACTSLNQRPSHVLTAMGLDRNLAMGSIRFSLGRFNTEPEIEHTIRVVKDHFLHIR
jgi:cysteine desulfurase